MRLSTALAVCGLAATGAHGQPRMLIYGDHGTNTPRSRVWSGSAWGAEAATLDAGGSPRWVVVKASPVRNEVIAAVLDSQNDINAMVYDGSAWGNLNEVTTTSVTNAERATDLAYEQSSGDALLVYRSGSTGGTAYYRTWIAGAWAAQAPVAFSGAGSPRFIKLVPKPGGDEIMVLIRDTSNNLSAMVWDGSAFGNKVLLEANTAQAGSEKFDGAYEGVARRCLVAWSVNGTTVPSYRIWTGNAWLAASTLPDVGGNATWLRLAPDRVSNTIIAMTLDGGADVNAAVWDGGAWGGVTEFETSAPNTDRRGFDVAFEPGGTSALAVYGRSGQNTPFYRTFNGSAWSAAVAGPDLSYRPSIIQLSPSASGHEILIGIRRNTDGALCFMRWTGATVSGLQVLYPDLPGPNSNETFMLINGLTDPAPRVTSWQEVAPG